MRQMACFTMCLGAATSLFPAPINPMNLLQPTLPLLALLPLWHSGSLTQAGPTQGAQISGQDQASEARSLSTPPRVAWYTSLDQARKDAARLNLPILVQSAAPQCRSVPGMW